MKKSTGFVLALAAVLFLGFGMCGCCIVGYILLPKETPEAAARRKAADAVAAVEAKQRDEVEAARRREQRDEFLAFVTEIGNKSGVQPVKLASVGDANLLTVTVRNEWNLNPYAVRKSIADSFWRKWVSIASPNDPDKSSMQIVDEFGNRVGGYSVFSGVWVNKE